MTARNDCLGVHPALATCCRCFFLVPCTYKLKGMPAPIPDTTGSWAQAGCRAAHASCAHKRAPMRSNLGILGHHTACGRTLCSPRTCNQVAHAPFCSKGHLRHRASNTVLHLCALSYFMCTYGSKGDPCMHACGVSHTYETPG